MNNLGRSGLGAEKTHHLGPPINIFRLQMGDIALRAANVPAAPEEGVHFRVAFTAENQFVFFPRHRPFFLVVDGRPLSFWHHRPGQPTHVHGEIVKPPEIIVGRNFAVFEHPQKMLRACLDQLPVTNRIEGFVHDRAFRAGPIAAGLDFDKLDHDLLPGAFDKAFIRGRQIGLGDLQVEGGLLPGLVFSVHKPRCGRAVAGMQTLLFARQIIVKVIPSAFLAAVESELLSHSCFSLSQR